MNFSEKQIQKLKEIASTLIDDGENYEYTRGICELLAEIDGRKDVSSEERSETIKNEFLLLH